MTAVELGGVLSSQRRVGTAQTEDADPGEVHGAEGIDPFGLAAFVGTIGDDEKDTAAGHIGQRAGDGNHGVPQAQALHAVGVAFGSVKVWGGERVIDAGAKEERAGRKVIGGADQGAVQGVDGDVVLWMEQAGRETGEREREVLHDGVVAVAGVDEDGEADGVVAFKAHLGGVEGGAGVEADVELCKGNGRERFASLAKNECGDLDEIGVDMKDVGSRIVLRGGGICAERGEQSGEEKERAN